MVKVLISGEVDGKFGALFKRVEAVNKSAAGPFDVLFCTGRFFPASNGPDDLDGPIPEEMAPYLAGTQAPPLPVVFIGAWGRGCRAGMTKILAMQAAKGAASPFSYLGRAGVKTVKGLQVAYLDGRFQQTAFVSPSTGSDPTLCDSYGEADVAALRRDIGAATGDIDFLLANEWPRGVMAEVPEAARASGPLSSGGQPVVEALKMARPRYFISGCSPIFYQRPPYVNADLGLGTHATRCIALAATGNDRKEKSLHALNVTPAADMTPEQLRELPADATRYPYAPKEGANLDQKKRERLEGAANEGLGDQGEWRWQAGPNKKQKMEMNQAAPSRGRSDIIRDQRKTVHVTNLPRNCNEKELIEWMSQAGAVEDVRRLLDKEGRILPWAHVQYATIEDARRACEELNNTALMGREIPVSMAQLKSLTNAQPVEGCWFCLSNPTAASWLICSIANEVYLSLDKSPIDPLSHVLLLPVEHFSCSLRLPKSAFLEVQQYLSSLRSYCASLGKDLIVFERFMSLKNKGGNHCHINCLAIPRAAAARAKATYQRAAQAKGFEFKEIQGGLLATPNADPAAGWTDPRELLRDYVGDMEYLSVFLPDGTALIRMLSGRKDERVPMNLLRDVAAELAGRPERADWRKCTCANQGEEEAMAERFKGAFGPFDFAAQDPEGGAGAGPAAE